jgi:transcription elongation factor Elf1
MDYQCAGEADHFKIYAKQIGGKYATFTCPSCGSPEQHFKKSSNNGHCDKCDTSYQSVSSKEADHTKGMQFPNYYLDLQCIG